MPPPPPILRPEGERAAVALDRRGAEAPIDGHAAELLRAAIDHDDPRPFTFCAARPDVGRFPKPREQQELTVVEATGLEPVTSTMPLSRSTS
jgi:hypothetical protein